MRAGAEGEAAIAIFHCPSGGIAGVPSHGSSVLSLVRHSKTRGYGTDGRHDEIDRAPVTGLILTADGSHGDGVGRTFNQAGNVGLGSVLHIHGEIGIVAGHMHLVSINSVNGQPAHVHGMGNSRGSEILRSDTGCHSGESGGSLYARTNRTAISHHAHHVVGVRGQIGQRVGVVRNIDSNPFVGFCLLVVHLPSGGVTCLPVKVGTRGGNIVHTQTCGSGTNRITANIASEVNLQVGQVACSGTRVRTWMLCV